MPWFHIKWSIIAIYKEILKPFSEFFQFCKKNAPTLGEGNPMEFNEILLKNRLP
jgi:hypothetical protein